ncbi:MAG: ATP-binding protein, partial [Sediminibacterium sp.]|nr:ATP-binding protein [Sediminibacterium sp.]
LGTLSVMDYKPNKLNETQKDALVKLANQVLKLIELNFAKANLDKEKNKYKEIANIYEQTNKVAQIGWWELNLCSGLLNWSDITKEIHDVDFDYEPKIDKAISFYKEGENRELIAAAVIDAIVYGTEADLNLEITSNKGIAKWVRVRFKAEITEDKANHQLHPNILAQLNKDQEIPVSKIYGTFQDITIQQKNIETLKQNESNIKAIADYYQNIIENQSYFLVKTDLEGNYTYINNYFCKMLGVTKDEYLGKSSLSLIIPEDHQACIDTVENCFKEPNKTHFVTLRKPSPKGILTNQWEFILIKDPKGDFVEFVCIGHEITELINKQTELQHMVDLTVSQNTRLQNFTHIISHNIRSHITNMSGVIHLVDKGIEDSQEILVDVVRKSVAALEDTIQNLNEVISIQSNLNIPKKELLLNEEIEKILDVLKINIEESKANIQINIASNKIIHTNPAYLESILQNLLTNAIKYRSPNRQLEIEISYQPFGKYYLLTVKDNGLGINMQLYKDKIFGMYKTFHRNKDSKGLGLFITKTQVEAMKGKIEVESEVDKGSTFKVFFYERD